MHLLPSRARPKQLQRFFDEGKPEQPGVVIIEEDQVRNYHEVKLPSHWHKIILPARGGYVASANAGFNAFPNEPWYGMSSDDSVGRTPHWDTVMAQHATEGRIVWPDDAAGLEHTGRCTFPFVPGDFCRTFGWFVHPSLWHFYSDTFWAYMQYKLDIGGGFLPDVTVEHLHYALNKAIMDGTYIERYRPTHKFKSMQLLGSVGENLDRHLYSLIDKDALAEKLRCLL